MRCILAARGMLLSLQVEPLQWKSSKKVMVVMIGPLRKVSSTQSVLLGFLCCFFLEFFLLLLGLFFLQRMILSAKKGGRANQHTAVKHSAFFFCFFSFFLSFFFFLSLDDEELEDESFPSAFLSHNEFWQLLCHSTTKKYKLLCFE